MDDHERNLKIEYDDISLKTKLVFNPFGGSFGTLRFNEKAYFNNLLDVSHHIRIINPLMQYMPLVEACILVIKF